MGVNPAGQGKPGRGADPGLGLCRSARHPARRGRRGRTPPGPPTRAGEAPPHRHGAPRPRRDGPRRGGGRARHQGAVQGAGEALPPPTPTAATARSRSGCATSSAPTTCCAPPGSAERHEGCTPVRPQDGETARRALYGGHACVGGAPKRRRSKEGSAPPRRARLDVLPRGCATGPGWRSPRLTRSRMRSDDTPARLPDRTVSVREVFGIDLDLKVPAYAETEEHVPTSIRTTSSTGRRRWPSWPASRATGA